LLLFLSIVFLSASNLNPFIYYRFWWRHLQKIRS
jgi:hypothetical protein